MIVVGSLLPALYLTAFTGFAWFAFGPTPYFVVPAFLIGVVSIFWTNRWMMLASGVIVTLAAVGGSQGDPGFLRPDRTIEYGYWWLTAVAGPAMLFAGVANVMHAKRGAPSKPTAWGAAGVALALALYLGGVATAVQEMAFVPAGASVGVGMKADVTLTMNSEADKFSPAALAAGVGQIVRVSLENADTGGHVFNQDDTGLAVDMPAGTTREAWLKFDAPGSYQYYCVLHAAKGGDGKWSGMVGAITIA